MTNGVWVDWPGNGGLVDQIINRNSSVSTLRTILNQLWAMINDNLPEDIILAHGEIVAYLRASISTNSIFNLSSNQINLYFYQHTMSSEQQGQFLELAQAIIDKQYPSNNFNTDMLNNALWTIKA